MEFLVNNMFFKGRTRMYPFQRGILTGITSLTKLFQELKSEGWNFLLTARTNQDVCEKIFSQLRTLSGPDNNPDSIEVLQRAKICLLEKEEDIF